MNGRWALKVILRCFVLTAHWKHSSDVVLFDFVFCVFTLYVYIFMFNKKKKLGQHTVYTYLPPNGDALQVAFTSGFYLLLTAQPQGHNLWS